MRAQDSPQQRVLWEAKHARTGPRRRAQQKVDKLAGVPPKNRLFAEKLQDAMTKAGLSKSEIARRIWGTTKDKRGFTVAKNRDRMGQYTSGATYPEPETLQKNRQRGRRVGRRVDEQPGTDTGRSSRWTIATNTQRQHRRTDPDRTAGTTDQNPITDRPGSALEGCRTDPSHPQRSRNKRTPGRRYRG